MLSIYAKLRTNAADVHEDSKSIFADPFAHLRLSHVDLTAYALAHDTVTWLSVTRHGAKIAGGLLPIGGTQTSFPSSALTARHINGPPSGYSKVVNLYPESGRIGQSRRNRSNAWGITKGMGTHCERRNRNSLSVAISFWWLTSISTSRPPFLL